MDEMNKKLLEHIKNSVSDVVQEKKIGIAFSGGVDSTLISKICSDMNYDIILLTIGFTESHDILFAKEVNTHLKYPHHVLEIDPETFTKVSSNIHQTINTDNLSWNENCIAFYYVSKLARGLNLDTVITANGIDELFCGYNAYRDAFFGGESQIIELMNTKLENELKILSHLNLMSKYSNHYFLSNLLNMQKVSLCIKKFMILKTCIVNTLFVNWHVILVYLRSLAQNEKRHYNMVPKFTRLY